MLPTGVSMIHADTERLSVVGGAIGLLSQRFNCSDAPAADMTVSTSEGNVGKRLASARSPAQPPRCAPAGWQRETRGGPAARGRRLP